MSLNVSFRIAAFLLMSLQASAQQWPFELWHEGKIVLVEGDTIQGMVKYDLMRNLVEFADRDKKAEVFTARKVAFFEIFDSQEKRYRQFYALPYNETNAYKTPVFFELLTEGQLTLLAREFLETRTVSSTYYAGSFTKVVLTHHYFLIDKDGNINQFNGQRSDLLNLMGKEAESVEKYMRRNRLGLDDKYDFSRIVDYYNSLVKS